VCRLRFGFHLDMVTEWGITRAVAKKARRWFNQFFDDSFGFKVFFHNSFRQFLLTKTAENPVSGNYDINENIKYHVRLADWSKISNIRLFHHEHLHHVHQAGQVNRYQSTLTPEYVDQQRHALRSFDSIREDISIGLQLAAEVQDLKLVLRYGFLMGEMYQRSWNMDESHFIEFFPKLFNFESVIEYALLPINSLERRKRAFKLARFLHQNGYESDARRLFFLAEPAAFAKEKLILDDENGFHWQEQVSLIEEWIKVKCLWFDPMELLESALKVEVVRNGNGNESIEKEREKQKNELQTKLIDALIESLSHSSTQKKHLIGIFGRFDYKHSSNVNFFLSRLHDVIATCHRENDDDLVIDVTQLEI